MKLKSSISPCISLYPYIDSRLACVGDAQIYPSDMIGRFVKRKKNISLIRFRRAGFAWVNNSDIQDDK